MAKFVMLDCQVLVNGVDFTDHCSHVEVKLVKKSVDTTNFSGGGFEQTQGLRTDSFTLTLQQDFAAAQVDATLYPLYNNGTEFTVEVRPHTAARSATNPGYVGTCILLDYDPLVGKPGQLSETKIKLPSQRTGITRQTS